MFQKEYSELKIEHEELQKQFEDPAVSADSEKMKNLSKRYNELNELIEEIEQGTRAENELEESKKSLEEESDESFKELLIEEIESLEKKITAVEAKVKEILYPSDPLNVKNVILEIRAGAGGDEASLFAGDLFRMYSLYAQKVSWDLEIIDHHQSDLGGFKEIIVFLKGRGVYGKLKYESGVHRVQRIPSTEKNGRVHTSTVTVAVLPEAEESEIEIRPEDIRVDVFRSSGPGGQSVNTTDSAVRLTHLPTGLVVSCQDQKSQHKNKEKALKVLSSRLLAFEEEKRQKEIGDMRSSQVGTGDRSEKIRTYNFPQNRLTDHRLKKNWYNLEKILEGEIEEILESF